MKKYNVSLTEAAIQDLTAIYHYIESYDSELKAEHVLTKINEVCESLEKAPQRGHYLPELIRLGVKEYRELHFKPYRIIYRIHDIDVYIYAILDGRRDMQTLLEHRLFFS